MRKFKLFFYPIYLIVVGLVLAMSLNIFHTLELFKQWGLFKYFSDLPYMARDLLVFMCTLMLIEIVIENFQLFSLRNRVSKLENDVLNLKAKLYDKSVEQIQNEESGEELEVVDEEEDDDD
jgi:hypothetical protein